MTKAANLAALGSVAEAPTGSAPSFQCRAWVNFTGTGTVTIHASGNVSSITDNGTGNYTINFTTAMPDINYAAVGSSTVAGSTNYASNITTFGDRSGSYGIKSTTQVQIYNYAAAAPAFLDPAQLSASVFR